MYAFEYNRPASVADAVSALQASSDAKIVAGGMTLIPTLKQRMAQHEAIIDLGGIAELSGISRDGDALVIGAMTTHAEVAGSAVVAEAIPGLAALAGGIGDAQVRNRGTIGGSVSNNDPAADYPAALVALNATVNTSSRSIAAEDFFTGMFETALGEDEIVTSISFPVPAASSYQKFDNPASRYAIVGVMIAKTAEGVRAAVTGAGPHVFRMAALEQALEANFGVGAVDQINIASDMLNADMHASSEYRGHLIKVMSKRAIAAIA